jgi:translation elongation factor EF-Tu-like GTPase
VIVTVKRPVNMQRFKPDFIAMVTYALPDEGGRTRPVVSGYQPVIRFEDSGYATSAENILTDREQLPLGETAEVNITMQSISMFSNTLLVGQHFEIYEPPNLVGRGVIKQIVNKNLEKE